MISKMNDKGKHRSKLHLASRHVQVYTIELKGKIAYEYFSHSIAI